MMAKRYLLDTNVCIALIRRQSKVGDKMASVGIENCFISEITIAELYYGAAKSRKTTHFDDVLLMENLFEIVPIYSALRLYGELKANLEQKGNRIDNFDLLIGATALHNNMTLVTHNTKHLIRIPNLSLEDWEI